MRWWSADGRGIRCLPWPLPARPRQPERGQAGRYNPDEITVTRARVAETEGNEIGPFMQQNRRQNTAAAFVDEHADDDGPAGQEQHEQKGSNHRTGRTPASRTGADATAPTARPPRCCRPGIPAAAAEPAGPARASRFLPPGRYRPERTTETPVRSPAHTIGMANARPRKTTAISALRPLTAKGTATAVRYQKGENRQARARFNNPRSPSAFSTAKTAARALSDGAAAPIRKKNPPRVRGSIEKGIPSQVPKPRDPTEPHRPGPGRVTKISFLWHGRSSPTTGGRTSVSVRFQGVDFGSGQGRRHLPHP